MNKMECPFCKIAAGEIPAAKVYEDDDVMAFLDLAPVNKGHTLVIPKEHHETLCDTPDELLGKLISTTKLMAQAVQDATNCGGINIWQNNHRVAGQAVPHIHFHVIPRFEGDGLSFWPQGRYEEGKKEEIRKAIEDAVSKA